MIARVVLSVACAGILMLTAPAGAQFVQQGNKLVGSGIQGVSGIYQGQSVALSADGGTAIVGGFMDNDGQGAAWIYSRTSGVWSQQGTKLVGTGVAFSGYQGYSVSLSADGNTAIVGGILDSNGFGAAWVYTRTAGVWSQQGGKLVGTGAVSSLGEGQGSSVSLSADGNTALVGGFQDSSQTGAAWVFTRSGGVWSQQGTKLVGTRFVGNPIFQGYSVSLSGDGNTAIVGGYGDSNQTGAAWVFVRSGTDWVQQGEKLVGTGGVGQTRQGFSVSLSFDGNTALIGAPWDHSDVGAFWVFTRSAGVWTQEGSKVVGTGGQVLSEQGWSASLSADGNTAVVGGGLDNGAVGAAWVFTRNGSSWSQLGSKLVGTGAAGLAYQGQSVSISGDASTVMVGGHWDSSNTGAAWVYSQSTTAVGEPAGAPPRMFELEQNYPNPFNPATTFNYSLPVRSSVHLTIVNVIGQVVATLRDRVEEAGRRSVVWDAGKSPSGIYFYRLDATSLADPGKSFTQVKRMLLVR